MALEKQRRLTDEPLIGEPGGENCIPFGDYNNTACVNPEILIVDQGKNAKELVGDVRRPKRR